MARELAISFAAFALGTALAELAGAVNLGTALAFGQIAFAIAVVSVLLTCARAGFTDPKG
jgi:uncharacterized membrane protein (DUF485 family)